MQLGAARWRGGPWHVSDTCLSCIGVCRFELPCVLCTKQLDYPCCPCIKGVWRRAGALDVAGTHVLVCCCCNASTRLGHALLPGLWISSRSTPRRWAGSRLLHQLLVCVMLSVCDTSVACWVVCLFAAGGWCWRFMSVPVVCAVQLVVHWFVIPVCLQSR
jgi:hypothetical protein